MQTSGNDELLPNAGKPGARVEKPCSERAVSTDGSNSAEAAEKAEGQKVKKSKDSARHSAKKVLSEKQRENLKKHAFTKENAKENGAKGGTAKGAAYELLRELVAEAKARNNVKKIFDDLDHGDFQNALARLSVLKQSGASFDQTDEGKEQKINVKGEVEQKRNIIVNFRKATPEDAK